MKQKIFTFPVSNLSKEHFEKRNQEQLIQNMRKKALPIKLLHMSINYINDNLTYKYMLTLFTIMDFLQLSVQKSIIDC